MNKPYLAKPAQRNLTCKYSVDELLSMLDGLGIERIDEADRHRYEIHVNRDAYMCLLLLMNDDDTAYIESADYGNGIGMVYEGVAIIRQQTNTPIALVHRGSIKQPIHDEVFAKITSHIKKTGKHPLRILIPRERWSELTDASPNVKVVWPFSVEQFIQEIDGEQYLMGFHAVTFEAGDVDTVMVTG